MRSEETSDECHDPDAEDPRNGFAPAAAGDWLELQAALALKPETVAGRLRAGATPKEILDQLRAQQALLPFEASSVHARARDSRVRSSREHRIERVCALGLRVVPLTSPGYPEALADLVDAPPVLLVRGSAPVLSSPCIAIVGARAATSMARENARRLARELAAVGFTIVSGLARGIDAEAHRGALEAGGCTIGVLACGPDQIYPPEHRALAREMAERGAIISEMPLGTPPRRTHFPLRNRIISGLCLGVIVVEARRRSGSLITVRHALGQGREVFVVPGSIDGPFAKGSNQLLRDGARPVCSSDDVIEDLAFLGKRGRHNSHRDREISTSTSTSASTGETRRANSLESRILASLQDGPTTREELLARCGRGVAELAGALLELELSGRIILERDGRIHARWR